MNASHWEANTTPFKTYSKMFMIKPASKPPRNTRAKLIFPIGILHERSPECRNSKGAEGTVGWSLRGGHGASQEERQRRGKPEGGKSGVGKARWRHKVATTQTPRGRILRGRIWFLACRWRGRGRLRAFWRCGGPEIRGCGNRRCRADSNDAGWESWTASLGRRGDRGRRQVSGWAAGRARLPWWRATVRRLARRGVRELRDFLRRRSNRKSICAWKSQVRRTSGGTRGLA